MEEEHEYDPWIEELLEIKCRYRDLIKEVVECQMSRDLYERLKEALRDG